MNRKTHITGDEIEARRPGGKSLQESYESHDIGHAHVVSLIESRGYTVEEYGIDERDHDASEGIITSEKMDLKVMDGDRLAAFIDVKSKTKPKWLGQFNYKDYERYLKHAHESGVPALIVMSLVNDVDVVDTFVTDVGEMNPLSSEEHDFIGRFPDGKEKCVIPHQYRHDIDYLFYKIGGFQ